MILFYLYLWAMRYIRKQIVYPMRIPIIEINIIKKKIKNNNIFTMIFLQLNFYTTAFILTEV